MNLPVVRSTSAGLIGVEASPKIVVKSASACPRPAATETTQGGRQMKRVCGVIAAGAFVLASAASPAAAKLNSCDGPVVLGTTISVTGINSSLAGRWDKMTDMFETRVQQDRRRVPQLMQQETADQDRLLRRSEHRGDRRRASTRKWRRSTMSTCSSAPTGRRTASRFRRFSRNTKSPA